VSRSGFDEHGRPSTPAHEAARRVQEAKPAPPVANPDGLRDDGIDRSWQARMLAERAASTTPPSAVHGHRDVHSGAYVQAPHGVSAVRSDGQTAGAVAHVDTGNAQTMSGAFTRTGRLPGRAAQRGGQPPSGTPERPQGGGSPEQRRIDGRS
jgi:hypothetical protein